jgi:hypothetical protein
MRRPEEQLHRAVAQYLAFTSLQGGFWFAHVPNGGARTKAEGGILKSMGVRAGVPDLLVIHQGRAFWLEVKAPPKVLSSGRVSQAKPRTSPEQVETIRALQLAGCEVAVVRSLIEVQALLKMWGIVK